MSNPFLFKINNWELYIMITLQKVSKENLDDVLSLTVAESQKTYVSSNAESLAQAYVYREIVL